MSSISGESSSLAALIAIIVVIISSTSCDEPNQSITDERQSLFSMSIPLSPPEIPAVMLREFADGRVTDHPGIIVYSLWESESGVERFEMPRPIEWPLAVRLEQGEPLNFLIPSENLPISLDLFAYRSNDSDGIPTDLVSEISCIAPDFRDGRCNVNREKDARNGWILTAKSIADSPQLFLSLSASWLGVDQQPLQESPRIFRNEAAWLFTIEFQ